MGGGRSLRSGRTFARVRYKNIGKVYSKLVYVLRLAPMEKICRGLYTELLYAIIRTCSAIPTSPYIFTLVYFLPHLFY